MADRSETITLKYDFGGTEEGRALAQTLTDIANGSTAAAPAARELVEQLNQLASQSAAIDKFVELKAAVGDSARELADAKQKAFDLGEAFVGTAAAAAKNAAELSKAEAQVAALTKQHNALSAQLASASGALQKSGIDTEHLDTAHRDLLESMNKVTVSAKDLTATHEKAGEAAKKTGDAHEEAGKKAHEAGTAFEFVKDHLKEIISVAAAVEIALKGLEFGKESLKGAEDVEAALSRVKATAAGAAEQLGAMEEAVERAAKAVNVDTQTSANGLAALASRGLDAKSAIDALVPTLQLAKIANIDVSTAAGFVAEGLKAFNLPATEAQHVVDLLTAASHGAAGGLGAMTNAVVTLAPDARALGLNLQQLTGLVGLLGEKGLDSEKSVRGLRTIFQDLQNPTSTLRTELLALGDGTNRVDLAIGALTAGTPRANQALLTLSGGARSIVETLGQEGPEAIAKFTAGLEAQNGVAERAARILDENLKGAATRFKFAIGDIGEQLAKPILEPLRTELEKLAKELNDFAASPDFAEIKKEIGAIVKEGIEKLDKALHEIDWKGFLKEGKEALKGIGEDLKAVADSASTIATVLGKTADGVGVAYHTLGVAVAEGTGLAALAIQELTGKTELLDDIAKRSADSVSSHLEKLGADALALAGASDKVAESTKKHGDAAAAAAPKVEQHAAATKDSAAATEQLVTRLPVMVAQLGQGEHAVEAFGLSLAGASAKEIIFQRDTNGTVDAVKTLQTAFAELRIKSQADLELVESKAAAAFNTIDKLADNTAKGLADRQNAFLAYAQTALAATAQLDEGARANARAQLESKAAVLGVTEALKDLEAASSNSQGALTSDADRARAALDKEFESAERLAGKFHGGEGGSISDSAGKAADATQEFAARGTSSLNELSNYMASTRAGFLGISDAAAKAFDARVLKDFNTEFDSTGIGFARTIAAIKDAGQEISDTITAQRADLQGVIDATNRLGTESVESFNKLGGAAKYSESQINSMIESIDNGSYQIGVLGKQELGPLRAALEDARQRVQALREAAAQATQQIAELNAQLQDRIDQRDNNQIAIENRSYEAQKQHIEDLAAQADAAGKAEADQALQRLEQLHQAKLKEIADTEAAQKRSQQNQQTQQQQQTTSAGGGGGSTSSSNDASSNTAVAGGIPVAVNYGGRTINLIVKGGSAGTPAAAADLFEDWLGELARAKANSI